MRLRSFAFLGYFVLPWCDSSGSCGHTTHPPPCPLPLDNISKEALLEPRSWGTRVGPQTRDSFSLQVHIVTSLSILGAVLSHVTGPCKFTPEAPHW
jgi:hypothetical protein